MVIKKDYNLRIMTPAGVVDIFSADYFGFGYDLEPAPNFNYSGLNCIVALFNYPIEESYILLSDSGSSNGSQVTIIGHQKEIEIEDWLLA